MIQAPGIGPARNKKRLVQKFIIFIKKIKIKMKKKLLFSIVCVLFLSTHFVQAQIINPGFETWSADMLAPTAMNPNTGNGSTGWWDFNFYNNSFLGSSPVSVTRVSDTVHSGTYAARIESKVYTSTSWNYYNAYGIPFIGHAYNDTLGILFNGNVNVSTPSYAPGIPCTVKLTQYKFWYQYSPNGNDTAECRVALLSNGTPVAGGVFKTGAATSGWQQATVNFTYISSLTPDTLYVLYSAASLDTRPKAHSILWVDDVTVTLATGIEEGWTEENAIDIFPNPSNGNFSVAAPANGNALQTVEVYNVVGELVYSETNKNKSTFDINISQSPKGIYFVKFNDGEKIMTEKIVVQ